MQELDPALARATFTRSRYRGSPITQCRRYVEEDLDPRLRTSAA
jgi:hypothetical protein